MQCPLYELHTLVYDFRKYGNRHSDLLQGFSIKFLKDVEIWEKFT
jgi:hypothetical protein